MENDDKVLLTLKLKNKDKKFSDFIEDVNKTDLLNDFELGIVSNPVYYLSDKILAHILENGLSSLYNYSVLLEDIISPDIDIDEIELIILKFISKLNGVKRLAIIDPYLFAGSLNQNHLNMFKSLISSISTDLNEIIFFTNDNTKNKNKILSVIPDGIESYCVVSTTIHDRFWIDIDKCKGIVIGTSFNGIGKKLALIDFLKRSDVEGIIDTLKKESNLI